MMILLLLIVFESPLDTSACVPFKRRIFRGLVLPVIGKKRLTNLYRRRHGVKPADRFDVGRRRA